MFPFFPLYWDVYPVFISRGKKITLHLCDEFFMHFSLHITVDGVFWWRARSVNVHGFCVVRSLDLTGPLLLGGVPKLQEDFPVRNRQFVGCMKNLRIDNQHIDMASFIANNGTLPGLQ